MSKLLLACIAVWLSAAAAGAEDGCGAAKHLLSTEIALPRAAAAMAAHHQLTVAVSGTASSTLPGPDGARWAYPAQLEHALRQQLPSLTVKVINAAKQNQTATELLQQFDRLIVEDKPSLLVWQTGTVDAIRGIDPDAFRSALEAGIDKLQSAGSDVILMNMQYSPRTESMIPEDVYAETLQAVALEREIPLFDRFAIMKEWSDLGTFDLHSATKDPETAERVHACIGELLANFIVAGLDLGREADAGSPGKGEK